MRSESAWISSSSLETFASTDATEERLGLAVAACVDRAGASFTLIERGASVGASWRMRHRRLHLHTAKLRPSVRAISEDASALSVARPGRRVPGPLPQSLRDVRTIALIRAGKIRLKGDVASFDRDGVQFTDGSDARFDTVVLATGCEAGVKTLTALFGIGDGRGYPQAISDTKAPGLFFVGFKTPPTGHLRQIAIDAQQVARAITARPS